jgi:capsular polysaccharide export protein
MTQPRLLVLSRGMQRLAALRALLDDYELLHDRQRAYRPDDRVLAWGLRPSALRASQYASRNSLAVMHIEDGFLRSVGLGASDTPLSIVLDDAGLYLHAARESRLESLIRGTLNDQQMVRARNLISAWRVGRVSKYNQSRDLTGDLAQGSVLVVDQTSGDASISCGNADARSFSTMLDAALSEHKDRTILLKIHPDVISGRKRGHFDLDKVRRLPRVHVMDYDAHPASLLGQVKAVYTVTSQLGFEALIWGKPVRVFGMPFYAGWDLTHDEQVGPDRRSRVSLEQLIHAVLIDYSRYVDPETGKRCEAETVLEWLALQRRMLQRFTPHIQAVGFPRWKKPYVREFFQGSHVQFVRTPRAVGPGSTVALWGRKRQREISSSIAGAGVVCLEDGFIRSVGLGANLIRPLSWVQDDRGIYYDATTVSRLECLLQQGHYTPDLLARAAALRQIISATGITKYNVARAPAWRRPPGEDSVLLVLGQVETDASILYGASAIRHNMGLLAQVRAENPSAWLIYKPHPDVRAGLRGSGRGEEDARRWCDEIVGDVPFDQLLNEVDGVHVLTSLGGFEALLRGKKVVTHGQPFYAGWGLTEDRALTDAVRARRNRTLTRDEMVACVLIVYPTYVSRVTHRFTTPERAVQELIEWRSAAPEVNRWRHLLARLFRKT